MDDQKECINTETDGLSQEEAKIYEKFKHATENNKFYDFLRKVFRKKYKPPKIHTDDGRVNYKLRYFPSSSIIFLYSSESSSESSSSSSSDESEEDDNASIDSRDFAFIKQDLNVCPKGCEQAIFDLTVSLRSQR